MQGVGSRGVVVVAAILLWLADPVSAQMSLGGANLEGQIESGVRLLPDEPAQSRRAKFEEYRDLPEGLFLEGLALRLFPPDEKYSLELDGSKWGQRDQEFFLGAGRLGFWDFTFEWNQIPHLLSTDARLLSTETSRGVFTLPLPRPSLDQFNAGRSLDDISVRWDVAKLSLVLTPIPDLDVKLEYTRTRKEGDRLAGVVFGTPGNNFIEVLQPIEQTIHDFRLKGTYAQDRWQVQFGYTFSLFDNGERSLIADNPCFANFASCGGSDRSGPPTGRVSLAPDNMAHTFNLGGGITLPFRTRLTGNFTYSLRLQNDAFLPHTINQTLAAPDLTLPERSLHGNVQTFLINVGLTTRLSQSAVLSTKYRFYDYADFSDQPIFPDQVDNDRSLTGVARRALRPSYVRQNADADVRWRLFGPLAFTLGTGWEGWDRNRFREVPHSDEVFGKAVLDATAADWLLLQLKYTPSVRWISGYHSLSNAEASVVLDPASISLLQSPLLRKFDEADRDGHRVDGQIQLTPWDPLAITPTASYHDYDYLHSALGLQHETGWSAGLDVSLSPNERLSFSAGYLYESLEQKMESRDRPVIGGFGVDFPDFNWISTQADTEHTVYAGLRVRLIPTTLEWRLGTSYGTALGRVETRNPLAPTSSTPANNVAATARSFPAFEDNVVRVDTSLSYRFWKNWTAKVGYIFESFDKHDWRTDTLNPFIPGVTSIWLGNDLRNYSAHIVAITLAYRFQ